jgi:2-keto-4-pentenoate hydratase
MLSLASLAPRHLKDYDDRRPGTIFDDPDFQPTVEDAYRLQFLVAGLRIQRGEAVAGYKIGCVSEAIQRQLRLDRPVFGHVWTGELHSHGSILSIDRFACLGIEGELAVRIAADGRSVAAAFPVIELHNNLFRRAPTSAELIANNAIHAGVVLPESQASGYTAGETIAVYRNGELAGTAPACVFPGGPAEAVERVQRHLRDWNLSLARTRTDRAHRHASSALFRHPGRPHRSQIFERRRCRRLVLRGALQLVGVRQRRKQWVIRKLT